MANFGPKVFHAVAKAGDCGGDNNFLTEKDLTKIGMHHVDPNNHLPSSYNIECIKNSIFKLFMMRARNQIIKDHPRPPTDPNDEHVTVTVTLTFNSNYLHPKLIRDDRAKTMGALGGAMFFAESIIVTPDPLDGAHGDMAPMIRAMQNLSSACGPDQNMEAAFAVLGDDVFKNLPY